MELFANKTFSLLPMIILGFVFSHCSLFLSSDTDDSRVTDPTGGEITNTTRCDDAVGPDDEFDDEMMTIRDWKIIRTPDDKETQALTPREEGGELVIDLALLTENLFLGYESAYTPNLLDKSVTVKMGSQIPAQRNHRISSELRLRSTTDTDGKVNVIRIFIQGGELSVAYTFAGQLTIPKSVDFDMINHKYWKVTFGSDSVMIKTRSEKSGWNLFHEKVLSTKEMNLFSEAEIKLRAIIRTESDNPSGDDIAPGTLRFGSINMCPAEASL